MKRERELLATRRDAGYVIAGRCSICHRPFESPIRIAAQASSQVFREFDNHACDEDVNQAAARIVRETTESH